MDLEKKITELGSAFEEFKKANDKRIDELKSKGHAAADTVEKVEKANEAVTKLQEEVDKLNKAINRPNHGPQDIKAKREELQAKLVEANNNYMRKGTDMPDEVRALAKELKTMSVDSDVDGGFFVSPEADGRIVKTVFESTPMRQLADQLTISSDSYEFLYDEDEADASWVGEQESRAGDTGTPQIKKVSIPVHEMHSKPKATQKLLDDAGVNLEAWLAGKVSDKFARTEAAAFVSGNGVGKPKGILAYAAGTSFNQVEEERTASTSALTADELIDLQANLKEAYQKNASWLINRLIVAYIRKLKSNDNQYIWQPGLEAGKPAMLLGAPVFMSNDLASSITASASLAIYGDFKAGYLIVDRMGIRVLRDPYSAKPFIEFDTTKRVGGGVQNFEALKVLRAKA